MMYVTFVNESSAAPVSDYTVNVYVNAMRIDGPFKLKGHRRSDGWLVLLEQFCKEQRERIKLELDTIDIGG